MKPREKHSDKEKEKEKNEKAKRYYEELITKIFKSSTKEVNEKNKMKIATPTNFNDQQNSPNNNNLAKLKLNVR